MRPTLSTTGQRVIFVALAFVIVGAVRALWPLIIMAGLLLGVMAVLYILSLEVAALLTRKCLEMAWWIPKEEGSEPLIIAGRPFKVRLLLRNRAKRPLGRATLRILPSRGIEAGQALHISVAALSESEVTTEVLPHAAGRWFLHGARLELGLFGGIYAIHAYFPNPLPCAVFPRVWPMAELPRTAPNNTHLHERVGVQRVRLRGMTGELREIRDHTPNDPFKHIAWKATARR